MTCMQGAFFDEAALPAAAERDMPASTLERRPEAQRKVKTELRASESRGTLLRSLLYQGIL